MYMYIYVYNQKDCLLMYTKGIQQVHKIKHGKYNDQVNQAKKQKEIHSKHLSLKQILRNNKFT